MNRVYLLTGGNLGNRMDNLANACALIEQYCGSIVQQSSIYETAAWGIHDQPDFYNQALEILSELLPEELMQTLLLIEGKMGRKREIKMGPRIIDIDILLFNNGIIHTPGLTVPHPRMHERKFVLQPLAEIAPAIVHPVFLKTIRQLLLECKDSLDVHKIECNN